MGRVIRRIGADSLVREFASHPPPHDSNCRPAAAGSPYTVAAFVAFHRCRTFRRPGRQNFWRYVATHRNRADTTSKFAQKTEVVSAERVRAHANVRIGRFSCEPSLCAERDQTGADTAPQDPERFEIGVVAGRSQRRQCQAPTFHKPTAPLRCKRPNWRSFTRTGESCHFPRISGLGRRTLDD